MNLSTQDLLIARLKDTATDELLADMKKTLGTAFLKHKEEWNNQTVEYIKGLLPYFSTTEIRSVWNKFENEAMDCFIDYDRIDALDPWLKTLDSDSSIADIILRQKIQQASHTLQKIKVYKALYTSHSGGLGRVLHPQIINLPNDPRKMRRLKRKEAKLRKKGVRLFDSNEDI